MKISGDIREKRKVEKQGICVFLLFTVHELSAVKNSFKKYPGRFFIESIAYGKAANYVPLFAKVLQ